MLIAKDSKLKLAGLLALTVLFVVLGVWMGMSAESIGNRGVGWLGAAFFSLGLYIIPKRLLSEGRAVSISGDGVSDTSWKIGTLAWSEVTGVWVAKIRGNKFVCFSLRQPEISLSRLTPAALKLVSVNRALGFGDFQLSAVGLDKSADDLVAEILRYVPAVEDR